MFAHITSLQYWKSEHTAQTCEDAFGTHLAEGVLAVADGVGSTLFSNLWARHLVQHFLTVPLLSDDPFEVEWWLRLAQEQYVQQLPALENMPWNVLQKVQREGSCSTLVAARFTQVSESSSSVQFVALGDSCIFVRKADASRLLIFPSLTANDFDQTALCFPSKLSTFNRYFQRPQLLSLSLAAGDRVVLATDAVARWVISAGNGSCASQDSALSLLLEQNAASWGDFIHRCREHTGMHDDDCTALIVELKAQATTNEDEPVLANMGHRTEVRSQRLQSFAQAVEQQNKELAALYFGDGQDILLEGVVFSREQLQQCRQVADALREMLQALRREVNQPGAAERLTPFWQRYALLLGTEPCAASVRETLEHLGVTVTTFPRGISAEMAALSPRMIAQRRRSELHFVVKNREMLALELKLQQALELQDDAAIVAAYERVRQSPYTMEIMTSLQCNEQVQQAQQRENAHQRMLHALSSKNIETIAATSNALMREGLLLRSDELQVATMARRLLIALREGDDGILLSVADELQQSPLQYALELTAAERDLVTQARLRLSAPYRAVRPSSSSNGSAAQEPTGPGIVPVMQTASIPEMWFGKICLVKRAYLFHWALRRPSVVELEQETLDDLVNATLIRQGIDRANADGASPPLLPEALLPEIFQTFSHDSMINYPRLLQQTGLTDENVKALLVIFLGRQLFEEYLLWEKHVQLQDWLREQYGWNTVAFRRSLEASNPWVRKLSWWRG